MDNLGFSYGFRFAKYPTFIGLKALFFGFGLIFGSGFFRRAAGKGQLTRSQMKGSGIFSMRSMRKRVGGAGSVNLGEPLSERSRILSGHRRK